MNIGMQWVLLYRVFLFQENILLGICHLNNILPDNKTQHQFGAYISANIHGIIRLY